MGGFDPLFGSYYEDVDLAFRLRWAGYRCLFAPDCRIHHDVSASYDHGSPSSSAGCRATPSSSSGRTCPPVLLALAVVPHLLFLIVQGLWRTARGRPRPFLRGKLDAILGWSEILARRQDRRRLAGSAAFRSHFALGPGARGDMRNQPDAAGPKIRRGPHHALNVLPKLRIVKHTWHRPAFRFLLREWIIPL